MKMVGKILAVIALFLGVSAQAAEPRAVVIGVAGPMTGPRASYGEQMREAAELAIAKINETGGMLGQKVVLEIGDDAQQAQQAVAVANRFVSRGVRYVVGHWGSGMTMPASDAYDTNNVLMITPASVLGEITGQGRSFIFRTVGTDKQLGYKIGEYVARTYQPKNKILAVVDFTASAALTTVNYMEESLNQKGFRNIVKETYTTGDKDFSPLVTKIKEIKPDVVFCSCYQIEGGMIIRAMRDAGITQPIIGMNVFNNETWDIAGPEGEGVVYVSDQDFTRNPAAQELVATLKAKKIVPQTYHFYTYAAFQVIQQAAKQAQSLESAKIAEAMRKGSFDTAIGKISYTSRGDLKNVKYQVYMRKNNRTVVLGEFNE